ncbi:MAG: protein kinase [Candidatus Zixiibacteriota bacterium]
MTQVAEIQTQTKEVRIGPYVLTGKIGQGGIAEIFRARQESLNRDVAIKILFARFCNDSEVLRRFERESVVIARLNHPNIVHVIDKGKAGNRYYFVMEYVDGTSLREVMDSTKIPRRTKLEMVAQICKALDYAHKNGVIHRDIKPANILIDREGNPMVADFGIAQIVTSGEGEVTASDMVMGTLAYMSPEQKISSTNVDQTTDIYALGVIVYEILTDKKPLGRFKMPSELDPSNPPEYDHLVQKCLAPEPKDRFQSANDLKNAILNAIGGGTTMKRTSDYAVADVESFVGHCQYLDTIKENKFASTILVENKVNKRLYVIKKHTRGEIGRKEAKLLTTLKHKNINNILGSGGDLKHTVVVSDYAQGGSLAERMVRKYDWEKAIAIGLQIAAGLDFAHKNNIVHGNLRPSNILFDADDTVKIADFGLPAHYEATPGKNWYGPPERKQSKLGDIYAIGVILHQLLAGRAPTYDASGTLRLDDIAGQLPDEIQKILTRLLAIRPNQRYHAMGEMQLDYEEFDKRRQIALRREQTQVAPIQPEKQSVPPWMLVAAGAILAITIVLVLFFSGAFN